ncbi:MAG: helix-turn-helix domain-containing protein, partial [Candidatus Woesearchaeota archaeon]|nr:helix-turn-helix domain-containing protein [Candidatus Woesearchaeota archaeon]
FKERKLPDSIVAKIYEAHKKGMSLSQAAEYAGGIHISTVSDYWAKKGLKPHYVPRRGVQKSKVDEEKLIKIIEANKRGMSLREAARFAEGISSTVIQKRWKRMGLKSPHEQYKRLTQSSIERIYEARKNGMSIREAAEYAGVAAGTVSRYWKQLLDNQTMKHQ